MWTMKDEQIKQLLPEIDGFIDIPSGRYAYEWFEMMEDRVLQVGWERVSEGSFAAVYAHPSCYGLLLKLYKREHHQRVGPLGTSHDADIIDRLGRDSRCMQYVARHPLAVVVTVMYGDELKVFMDDEHPWREVRLNFDDINRQIASFIRFCISKGVVPYDLGPRNIFYDLSGELGFIDYGLYKLIETFTEHHPNTDPFEYAFRQSMRELGETVSEDMFD